MQKKNVVTQNLIVGVSFIIALILLYFGINFLKGDNIFRKKNTYLVLFEDVTDLHASSPVYINGYQIGLVNNVRIYENEPITFLVEIGFQNDYKVPKGSKVEFSTDFLGASAVNLIPGNPINGYLTIGDTLSGTRKKDVLTNVESLLPRVDTVIEHTDSVLRAVYRLLSQPEVESLSGKIEQITAELINSGKGVNILIDELSENLPNILGNIDVVVEGLSKVVEDLEEVEINRTIESFNLLLEDVRLLTTSMTSEDGSFGKLLHTPHLHDSLSQVLFNASELLEEIKLNPKKYLTIRVKLF